MVRKRVLNSFVTLLREDPVEECNVDVEDEVVDK